jgi:hypothetical protein
VKSATSLTVFLLAIGYSIAAEGATPNWGGKYSPCNRHSDLLNREHMDLAEKYSTSNAALAQQFERAMDIWTGVLDLVWHQVDSDECSVQLVDGTPEIFDSVSKCGCLTARSQFPDRPAFQGWIAFNPRLKFNKEEMFLDAVHEIGHLLGLPHNPDSSSVMYFFELEKAVSLDAVDLDALSARHKLRAGIFGKAAMADARIMVLPKENTGHSRSWFRGIGWWPQPNRPDQTSGRPDSSFRAAESGSLPRT